MPKRKTAFDKSVERLAELRRGPPDAASAELRDFLTSSKPYLVSRAAEVAAELQLFALGPELRAAFKRLISGEQEDTRCMALTKVAAAMGKLEIDATDEYLAGLKLERPEGVNADSAVGVRIECAHALVTTHARGALFELTARLTDPQAGVRAEVARALGRFRSEAAAAVLELKLLSGDADGEVLGACLAGMLDAEPEHFLPVVAGYLRGGDERLAELAALALGETRRDDAVAALVERLQGQLPSRLTAAMLLGLAVSRSDRGAEELLRVLDGRNERLAVQALSALAVLKHRPGVADRVRAIVERRGSDALVAGLRAFDAAP